MALNFTPEIWSKLALANLNKLLVADNITNQDYDGDFNQAGDTVHAFLAGDVTITNYVKNTDHATPQTMSNTDDIIYITQQKMYNYFLDRVDIKQIPLNLLNLFDGRAHYAMRDVMDLFILGYYVYVANANKVTMHHRLSPSNIYTYCAELQRRLTVSKVPLSPRFLVIDAYILEVINQYLAGKNTSLGDQATVDGYVGKFCGFDIYLSSNVPIVNEAVSSVAGKKDVHKCLAGHKMGITFPRQIPPDAVNIAYVPERRFGTAVKSLCVYGAKMLYNGQANGLLNAWL